MNIFKIALGLILVSLLAGCNEVSQTQPSAKATKDILHSSLKVSDAEWRRGDSNPRPVTFQTRHLHV